MKPFDLKQALEGAELITRKGHRVINFQKRSEEDIEEHKAAFPEEKEVAAKYPYMASVQWKNNFVVEIYTEEGTYFHLAYSKGVPEACSFDLFMKEESDEYYGPK